MTKGLPGYSLGQYAERRGCSKQAVSRAIKRGRLPRSVQRFDGVPRIIDLELADQEWRNNTLATKAPFRSRVNDERRRELILHGDLVAPHWDPVPREELNVEIDEDVIEVYVSSADVPDHLDVDQFSDFRFPLSPETARWLAGELLRVADEFEQAAAPTASLDVS